jgi:hypothetical protein
MNRLEAATHWTDAGRARHFIIPDDAELAPGGFVLRTSTGKERSVDESAVAPYAVSEEEAHAWAREQLTAVFGEMRQQTLGFVDRLRQKTAELRAENRRTWEQAVADAPPEVREAGAHLRDMLKDLGAALQQAARDHGYTPDAQGAPSPSAEPPSASAPSATVNPSVSPNPSSAATNPPHADPPSATTNPPHAKPSAPAATDPPHANPSAVESAPDSVPPAARAGAEP